MPGLSRTQLDHPVKPHSLKPLARKTARGAPPPRTRPRERAAAQASAFQLVAFANSAFAFHGHVKDQPREPVRPAVKQYNMICNSCQSWPADFSGPNLRVQLCFFGPAFKKMEVFKKLASQPIAATPLVYWPVRPREEFLVRRRGGSTLPRNISGARVRDPRPSACTPSRETASGSPDHTGLLRLIAPRSGVRAAWAEIQAEGGRRGSRSGTANDGSSWRGVAPIDSCGSYLKHTG